MYVRDVRRPFPNGRVHYHPPLKCTRPPTPIMGVCTNFPKNRPGECYTPIMGVCIKKSPRRVLHARTRPLWACALENRDQCAFNNKCPRECFVAEYLELALKELRMEALRRSKFPHFLALISIETSTVAILLESFETSTVARPQ